MLLRTEDCVRDKDPRDVMEEVGLCCVLWEWIELSLLDLEKTPVTVISRPFGQRLNGKF